MPPESASTLSLSSSSFIIARRPSNIFRHYDRDFITMYAFFYTEHYTIYKFKALEKPPFPPCPVGIERRMGIIKKLMRHPVGVTLPHEQNNI
jgi:hypothetical protein